MQTRCNKNQHHGAWCYWCCIPFQRGLYLRHRLLNLKSPKLNGGVCCILKICSGNQGTLVGDSRCKTPVESIHEHPRQIGPCFGVSKWYPIISGQLGLIWLSYIYYMLLNIYSRVYPYNRCFQQIFVDFRIPPCFSRSSGLPAARPPSLPAGEGPSSNALQFTSWVERLTRILHFLIKTDACKITKNNSSKSPKIRLGATNMCNRKITEIYRNKRSALSICWRILEITLHTSPCWLIKQYCYNIA